MLPCGKAFATRRLSVGYPVGRNWLTGGYVQVTGFQVPDAGYTEVVSSKGMEEN